MNVDDFVVLGRAVPVLLKDRRKTICAAGFSEKLGFTRIYPTYWTDNIHRWDILSTNLTGDRRDSRLESWKRENKSQKHYCHRDLLIEKILSHKSKVILDDFSKRIDF